MIKLLCFIFPFVFLDACLQIGPNFYYEIKNESLYPIEIKVFNKGKLNEKVFIEPMGSYIEETNSKIHLTPFNDEVIDSIVVVFDNEKAIIQYCEGRPLIGTTPICGEIEDNLSDFNFGSFQSGRIFKRSSLKITFNTFSFLVSIV